LHDSVEIDASETTADLLNHSMVQGVASIDGTIDEVGYVEMIERDRMIERTAEH
jgi:hypothetical protein